MLVAAQKKTTEAEFPHPLSLPLFYNAAMWLALFFSVVLAAAPAAPRHALALEYRHGTKLLHFYEAPGFRRERLHNVQSLSKSVLALLVGIARERDLIEIDENIGPFLGANHVNLSWRDLLTMRSGFPSTSRGNYGAWVSSPNWVEYIFRRKQGKKEFSYSTGDSHLLAVALKRKLSGRLQDFAREHLFRPLGIERVVWDKYPQGNEFGGNNLRLSFEAVSRLGRMLLDDGRWQQKRIVSSEWIQEMWEKQTEAPDEFVQFQVRGYGYFWWLVKVNEIDGVCALGYGGQFLCLFPKLGTQFTLFSRTPKSPAALKEHYREVQDWLRRLVKDA